METEGQAAVLRAKRCDKRCDKLQGFLFARPMPAQDLVLWALRSQAPDARLDFSAAVFADQTAMRSGAT